ncbi:hypothetical protein [Fodinicurvata halophila]
MDTAVLRTHPLFSFGTLQDADVFAVVTGGLAFEQTPDGGPGFRTIAS